MNGKHRAERRVLENLAADLREAGHTLVVAQAALAHWPVIMPPMPVPGWREHPEIPRFGAEEQL